MGWRNAYFGALLIICMTSELMQGTAMDDIALRNGVTSCARKADFMALSYVAPHADR